MSLRPNIELADAPAANPDPTGVFASIKAFFDGMGKPAVQQETQEEPKTPPAPAAPEFDGTAFAAFGTLITQMAASVNALATSTEASITTLTADLKKVADTLENTPANGGFTQRSPATGGGANDVRTDC